MILCMLLPWNRISVCAIKYVFPSYVNLIYSLMGVSIFRGCFCYYYLVFRIIMSFTSSNAQYVFEYGLK